MAQRKTPPISADKKLQILKEATASGQVAETCRRHGISTGKFYAWRKRADEAARAVLAQNGGRPRRDKAAAERERLERELDRARRVIAEITAENLDLKKGL